MSDSFIQSVFLASFANATEELAKIKRPTEIEITDVLAKIPSLSYVKRLKSIYIDTRLLDRIAILPVRLFVRGFSCHDRFVSSEISVLCRGEIKKIGFREIGSNIIFNEIHEVDAFLFKSGVKFHASIYVE